MIITDEDWNNENREPIIALQHSTATARRNSKSQKLYVDEPLSATRYRDNPPSYIYPKEPQDEMKKFHRSNSREEEKSQESSNSREEEVKPIITKQSPRDKRFSYVMANEDDFIEPRKYSDFGAYKQKSPVYEDDRKRNNSIIRQKSERYGPTTEIVEHSRIVSYQQQYKPSAREMENLTDRQKYRELAEKQKYHDSPSPPSMRHVMYRGDVEIRVENPRKDYSPERVKTIQRTAKRQDRYYPGSNEYFNNEDLDKIEYHPSHNEKLKPRYHDMSPPKHHGHTDYIDRNPYREPASLPYRESIEKMMKSPVMRYRSFENDHYPQNLRREEHHVKYKTPIVERSPSPPPMRAIERERYNVEVIPARYHNEPQAKYPTAKRPEKEKRVHIENASPESTMKKVSPKDRFQDAKEKFQAMERIRLQEQKQSGGYRRSEPMRREMVEHSRPYSPNHVVHSGWSSEDDLPVRENYRELPAQKRYPGLDKYPPQQQPRIPRMLPAKSLSNLTKGGYRHSYAEPMKYCGRVGLAAINPY